MKYINLNLKKQKQSIEIFFIIFISDGIDIDSCFEAIFRMLQFFGIGNFLYIFIIRAFRLLVL